MTMNMYNISMAVQKIIEHKLLMKKTYACIEHNIGITIRCETIIILYHQSKY